jgi:hypothetical protein
MSASFEDKSGLNFINYARCVTRFCSKMWLQTSTSIFMHTWVDKARRLAFFRDQAVTCSTGTGISFFCTSIIHTNTKLNWFRHYMYCTVKATYASHAEIFVVFLWFIISLHVDLKCPCLNMTMDKQLYLQNVHALPEYVFNLSINMYEKNSN